MDSAGLIFHIISSNTTNVSGTSTSTGTGTRYAFRNLCRENALLSLHAYSDVQFSFHRMLSLHLYLRAGLFVHFGAWSVLNLTLTKLRRPVASLSVGSRNMSANNNNKKDTSSSPPPEEQQVQQESSSRWDASVVSILDYEKRVEPFTGSFVNEMIEPFINQVENNHKAAAVDGSPRSYSILDIGCGTGIASLKAYKRGFQVTSTDLSEDMVNRCCERLEEQLNIQQGQNPNTHNSEGEMKFGFQCVAADGQNLPSEWVNRFDYAVGNFSIIFFPDPIKGLKEIYRCLTPGSGQVVISAWGNAEETPAFQVFPEAIRDVVGDDNSKDDKASSALIEASKSKRITGSSESLTALLQDAGFIQVRVVGPIERMLAVPSAEAFYDRFALTSPNIRATISKLPPDQVNRLRMKVMELATERGRMEGTDKIEIPSSAYFAYGTKPNGNDLNKSNKS